MLILKKSALDMIDISLEELDINSRALQALELISNSSRVISSTYQFARTVGAKQRQQCDEKKDKEPFFVWACGPIKMLTSSVPSSARITFEATFSQAVFALSQVLRLCVSKW